MVAKAPGGTPVPPLTDEQRREALARATTMRHERAEMLRKVKAREVDPRGVLLRHDPVAARTRVLAFVASWPGYGKARARKVVEGIGISPSRRLGGLGARQREALVAAMPEFRGEERQG